MNSAAQSVQETLDAGALFAGFERDGFYLRNPATRTDGLYGTTTAGDCLTPIIVEGDYVHIELGAQPEHGDIALIQWSAHVVESWKGTERAAQWAGRFGSMDMSRALKLVRDFPQVLPPERRTRYWTCRDNFSKSASALGVVRGVTRNGVLLTGDIVHRPVVALSGIDQHAATDIVYTTISSVTVPAGSGYTTIGSISIPGYPGPVQVIVTASGTYQQNTVSSQYGLYGGISTSNSSIPTANIRTISWPPNAATAQYNGQVSIESVFTLSAGAGAQTFYFLANGAITGSGNTCVISEVMLKAEVIKL
jgi:hypothetical protein